MYSTAGSYLGFVPQLALAPTRLAGSVMALQQLCSYLDGLQLAGGLKKLSRGQKEFLASDWTLKLAYASHIQDLTSGWKSFGPYAKHMPRALSEATIKFTSGHQSLVCAYA